MVNRCEQCARAGLPPHDSGDLPAALGPRPCGWPDSWFDRMNVAPASDAEQAAAALRDSLSPMAARNRHRSADARLTPPAHDRGPHSGDQR